MSKEPDNALNQCLRSVWQRSQQKHIAGGLLAFARWFVPLFLLVVVIDRFIDLPDWLRGGSSILLIVAVLRKSWSLGWRQLRRFNSNHVCRQIERSYKGVDGLFVTATQFRQKGQRLEHQKHSGSTPATGGRGSCNSFAETSCQFSGS